MRPVAAILAAVFVFACAAAQPKPESNLSDREPRPLTVGEVLSDGGVVQFDAGLGRRLVVVALKEDGRAETIIPPNQPDAGKIDPTWGINSPCSAWGLALPFYSSRRNVGGTSETLGPVQSGIGAGYFYPFTCTHKSSIGGDLLFFSQGLTPGTNVQIGVGAGLSVTAFDVLNFGVDLGADLYREFKDSQGSLHQRGILVGKFDRTNFVWMFTLKLNATQQANKPDGGASRL